MVNYSRNWSSLWRSRTSEVGARYAIPESNGGGSDDVSMDVLGIHTCIFQNCWPFYRRYGKFWDEKRYGCTKSRKCRNSRNRFLSLSTIILVGDANAIRGLSPGNNVTQRLYSSNRSWRSL
jgi:hypothetical protein